MNVAKRKVAGAVLGKAAGRLIPGLGLLITAYELWDWYNGLSPQPGVHYTCSSPLVGAHWTLSGAVVGSTHVSCTSGGALKSTSGFTPGLSQITTTSILNYVQTHHTRVGFPDRYVTTQCVGPFPNGTVVKWGARAVPKFGAQQRWWEQPEYLPWYDPSLPPQMQPHRGFDPLPSPRPVVWPKELPAPGGMERWHPAYRPGNPARERARRRRQPRIDPRTGRPRRNPRTRVRPPFPFPDPITRPIRPIPLPLTDPPPAPGTAPGPGVAPAPGVATPTPAPVPGMEMPPGWEVVVEPGTATVPILRPGQPPSKPVTPPPGPRPKETKLGANRAGMGWLLWLFNFTTETRDFVDAIYKALPCAARSRKDDTAAKKMDRIYDNWEQLDWAAAVNELFLNQVEDYVIGRAQGAISKGFGSGESWANYMRQIGMDRTTGYGKALGKNVNDVLDDVAAGLGLHRVKCGRR